MATERRQIVAKLSIETIKLDALKPDPNNARKHSERNLDAIKGSLQAFGQRKPIVVAEDNTVIAGNGTVEAAKQLGWVSVSATRIPADWTPEQVKAYAIADNRTGELATWDQNELLSVLSDLDNSDLLHSVGFDTQDVDNLKALMEELEQPPAAPKNLFEQEGMYHGNTLSTLAERYATAATRVLMCDYPNTRYIWLIEKLATIRSEKGYDSNSDAIIEIVQDYFGEIAPE